MLNTLVLRLDIDAINSRHFAKSILPEAFEAIFLALGNIDKVKSQSSHNLKDQCPYI